MHELDSFEKCLNSCSCDEERIIELYRFIISIKLNDIFARGFSLDERLTKATKRSAINIVSEPDNLLNLYDVILLATLDDFSTTVSQEFVIVFNSFLDMPMPSDKLLGFYKKSTIVSNQEQGFYDEIDDRLKFSFSLSHFFCATYPYVKKFIQMYDLMMNRIVCGTKTILQKENTDFQNRNSSWGKMLSTVLPQNRSHLSDSNAFLDNDEKSVLTVPPNTNILFPTADLTQIDKAYMRAVDMLLAVFRIPSTKFFGGSPSGFQSTGNLEILNYEQSLDEIFNNDIKPILDHMSELINSDTEVQSVSFYKLQNLDKINNVRATTDSAQIREFCDQQITAISGIQPTTTNNIDEEE